MASEKVTNLLEEIKALTVLELSELVKEIEEEFDVTAQAAVAVAAVTSNSSSIALTSSESSRTVRFLISSNRFVTFSDAILILL